MKVVSVTWLLIIRCVLAEHLSTKDTARHLTNCVSEISERYFQSGRLLVVDVRSAPSAEDYGDQVLKRLHEHSTWPIILSFSEVHDKKTAEQEVSQEKAMSYVFLTDVQKFQHQIETAHDQLFWNSRAFFLVVVTQLSPRNKFQPAEVARQILATLWERKVSNAAVLITSSSNAFSNLTGLTTTKPLILDVYTWFPFHPPECAGSVLTATLLDRWLMEGNGTFCHQANLFPPKVPKSLNRCPLHVTTFDAPPFVVEIPHRTSTGYYYDGLEVQMLRTLANIYNFTIIFHSLANNTLKGGGAQLANGTWTGVFSDIMTERVHISFGSLIPTKERFTSFDFTLNYVDNAVVWVVPKAKTNAPWRSLYRIFSPLTWQILFFVYNVVVLVMWLLAKRKQCCTSESIIYRSLSSSYQTVLSIQLGISVTQQPRSNVLRIFFFLLVCYSLWVATAYQSALISSITKPFYMAQITTEKELLLSDLELGVSSDYDRYFDFEDPADRIVKQRIVTYCGDDILSCLNRVVKGDLAFVADRALVQFLKNGRGKTPFKILRSNVFSYFVGMAMPKGSVLLEPFNGAIRRINQAYLIPKWRNDLAKRFKSWSVKSPRYTAKKVKTSTIIGPQRLTVAHLQGSFVLLLVRCAIAIAIFIFELAFNRFRYQSQHQVLSFVH